MSKSKYRIIYIDELKDEYHDAKITRSWFIQKRTLFGFWKFYPYPFRILRFESKARAEAALQKYLYKEKNNNFTVSCEYDEYGEKMR